MSINQDRAKFFFWGAVIGGALGTVTALLFAPVSGKRMRRKIADKADTALEEFTDYVEQNKRKAEELIKEGKKKIENIVDSAKRIVPVE